MSTLSSRANPSMLVLGSCSTATRDSSYVRGRSGAPPFAAGALPPSADPPPLLLPPPASPPPLENSSLIVPPLVCVFGDRLSALPERGAARVPRSRCPSL